MCCLSCTATKRAKATFQSSILCPAVSACPFNFRTHLSSFQQPGPIQFSPAAITSCQSLLVCQVTCLYKFYTSSHVREHQLPIHLTGLENTLSLAAFPSCLNSLFLEVKNKLLALQYLPPGLLLEKTKTKCTSC